MKSLPLFAVAAASLFALSACNSQPKAPKVIDSNPDPMANELANAAPVELPPAIRAEKTFRCKDQSLIYVNFFEGDKQANIRLKQNGPPTIVRSENAGEPKTAEGGWRLTGDENAITIVQPGKAELSCKS